MDRDNQRTAWFYELMGAVLILLSVLMVVGAAICLIAILGMWDEPSKPDGEPKA